LVTTLTKKMSEKLADFLALKGIRAPICIRKSKPSTRENNKKTAPGRIRCFDRHQPSGEGLDLPEVSLVIILDADKEGFLRSSTRADSDLCRAARNIDGKVILYIDTMVESVSKAIAEAGSGGGISD